MNENMEVIFEHQAQIAGLEQGYDDHNRRICIVEKKLDRIYQMQWVILATVLSSVVGGIIVSYIRLF